jgi:hypothetical protein
MQSSYDYNFGNQTLADAAREKQQESQQKAVSAHNWALKERRLEGTSVREEFSQLEKLYLGGALVLHSSASACRPTRSKVLRGIAGNASGKTVGDDSSESGALAEEPYRPRSGQKFPGGDQIAAEIAFVQETYLSKPRDSRMRVTMEVWCIPNCRSASVHCAHEITCAQVAANANQWKGKLRKDAERVDASVGAGRFDDQAEIPAESDSGDEHISDDEHVASDLKSDAPREVSLEMRGRMARDLAIADITAAQFVSRLVVEGLTQARAEQIASLTR